MQLKNLLSRLLTAGLILPVLAVAAFLAPPWVWFLLVAFAEVIAAKELFSMTHGGDRIAQAIGVASTLIVSITVYCFSRDPRVLLTVLLAVPVAGMLVPLWRLGEIATAGLRQMAGVSGPLYIGVLLTTVAMLRRDLGDSGPGYVALSLTLAWFADTAAYISGSYFGKAKLYPEISPAKTRAGFLGALAGASLAALLAHFWYLPAIPVHHGLGLALVGGAMGQAGDLAESLLKRSSGMKDSGRILPGHGGLLDRLDALMIVGPIVYLYALWVPGIAAG
ncbi:MAG: phosphatidate cytidylyltransferase [Polyangiaceae bacterium]|nr:phosphatidate cytidylyltransferase [Polyangiaceae bacterium]